jgi:CRP/FNR family transcriptional regulator, cyclic AMP receptor protein
MSFTEHGVFFLRKVDMSYNDHHGRIVTTGEAPMQESTTHANSAFADVCNDPTVGARRASVAAGTVFYEPEDNAVNVHFIHRGQVRLYQVGPEGSQRLVEILGPGDWFGVAALAKADKYGLRAVAMVNSVVSEARADRVYDAVSQKPQAALELSRQLAQKVQSARDEAASLIFQDCNNRLIQTLIRFSDSAAATPNGEEVVLRITHHQLAQAVGVARETVSLALTQLRHQNLLRTGRNQLTFKPDALRQFTNRNADCVKNVA